MSAGSSSSSSGYTSNLSSGGNAPYDPFAIAAGSTYGISSYGSYTGTSGYSWLSGGGGGGGVIGGLLCNVANWFTGSIGQGIATLAIIVLGIGGLFGKVSHGMALVTLVGIATIFGAPQIVEQLTGQIGVCW